MAEERRVRFVTEFDLETGSSRVLDETGRKIADIGDEAEDMGRRAERGFSTFERSLIGVAQGLEIVERVARIAGEAIDAAIFEPLEQIDELQKLADQVGLSTRELTQYRLATELADVQMSEFGQGLAIFSRRIAETAAGTGEARGLFRAMGVEIEGADGRLRSASEILLDVSDTFAILGPSVERTALAQELFGRSGTQLIPFLQQGSEELAKQIILAEEHGRVFDEDVGRGAERANDAITTLKSSIAGMSEEFATKFAPAVERGANALTRLVEVARENSDVLSFTARGALRSIIGGGGVAIADWLLSDTGTGGEFVGPPEPPDGGGDTESDPSNPEVAALRARVQALIAALNTGNLGGGGRGGGGGGRARAAAREQREVIDSFDVLEALDERRIALAEQRLGFLEDEARTLKDIEGVEEDRISLAEEMDALQIAILEEQQASLELQIQHAFAIGESGAKLTDLITKYQLLNGEMAQGPQYAEELAAELEKARERAQEAAREFEVGLGDAFRRLTTGGGPYDFLDGLSNAFASEFQDMFGELFNQLPGLLEQGLGGIGNAFSSLFGGGSPATDIAGAPVDGAGGAGGGAAGFAGVGTGNWILAAVVGSANAMVAAFDEVKQIEEERGQSLRRISQTEESSRVTGAALGAFFDTVGLGGVGELLGSSIGKIKGVDQNTAFFDNTIGAIFAPGLGLVLEAAGIDVPDFGLAPHRSRGDEVQRFLNKSIFQQNPLLLQQGAFRDSGRTGIDADIMFETTARRLPLFTEFGVAGPDYVLDQVLDRPGRGLPEERRFLEQIGRTDPAMERALFSPALGVASLLAGGNDEDTRILTNVLLSNQLLVGQEFEEEGRRQLRNTALTAGFDLFSGLETLASDFSRAQQEFEVGGTRSELALRDDFIKRATTVIDLLGEDIPKGVDLLGIVEKHTGETSVNTGVMLEEAQRQIEIFGALQAGLEGSLKQGLFDQSFVGDPARLIDRGANVGEIVRAVSVGRGPLISALIDGIRESVRTALIEGAWDAAKETPAWEALHTAIANAVGDPAQLANLPSLVGAAVGEIIPIMEANAQAVEYMNNFLSVTPSALRGSADSLDVQLDAAEFGRLDPQAQLRFVDEQLALNQSKIDRLLVGGITDQEAAEYQRLLDERGDLALQGFGLAGQQGFANNARGRREQAALEDEYLGIGRGVESDIRSFAQDMTDLYEKQVDSQTAMIQSQAKATEASAVMATALDSFARAVTRAVDELPKNPALGVVIVDAVKRSPAATDALMRHLKGQ